MTTNNLKKRGSVRAFTYYNFDKIHSYNAVINMVVGARGLGKTYGKKMGVIRDAVRNGNEFIYLRRYQEELKESRVTFFGDVTYGTPDSDFPDFDFRLNGKRAEFAPITSRSDKKRVWSVMGYFVPLVTASHFKSVSYKKVRTIMFDEFIIEEGHVRYLTNEVNALLHFYSTVDRNQDRVRLFMFANSVSIDNPYFITWNIEPKPDNEWFMFGDGFVVCHFPDSEKFRNEVYQTRFGKFIKDSEFATMAVGNVFVDNNESMLGKKDAKAKPKFNIKTRKRTFSVWHSKSERKYFVITGAVPDLYTYTLDATLLGDDENVHEAVMLVDRSFGPFQVLRTHWRSNMVLFDRAPTRNAFMEIFK